MNLSTVWGEVRGVVIEGMNARADNKEMGNVMWGSGLPGMNDNGRNWISCTEKIHHSWKYIFFKDKYLSVTWVNEIVNEMGVFGNTPVHREIRWRILDTNLFNGIGVGFSDYF